MLNFLRSGARNNAPKQLFRLLREGRRGETRLATITKAERLAAITTLSESAEYLTQLDQIHDGGVNHWPQMRDDFSDSPLIQKILDLVANPYATRALHIGRLAGSLHLLFGSGNRSKAYTHILMFGSGILLHPRHLYGTDGSDQVTTLVNGALSGARFARRDATQDGFLWLLSLQSSLSYAASGLAKLAGEEWRLGRAFTGVMRTESYGHPKIYRLTQRHPWAAKALTISVVTLECVFPIVYFVGPRARRVILDIAASFHIGTAFMMGLSRFATSFIAMHPAVEYTANKSLAVKKVRDDRTVRSLALVLAGIGAVCGWSAFRRRISSRTLPPNSDRLMTRSMNQLEVKKREGSSGEITLILAPGLASPAEHLEWLVKGLQREMPHLSVATYNRSGYGASVRGARQEFTLSEAVDDLVDVAQSLTEEGGDVLFIGHSLGGELCRRAALEMGDRCFGVVYLDSSHPHEFRRSSRQSARIDDFSRSIGAMRRWLTAGSGFLLPWPKWIRGLPVGVRQRMMDQYGDARLWRAASREWSAVRDDFNSCSEPLRVAPGKALSLGADATVEGDPVQGELHQELVDSHVQGGIRHIIKDVDHDMLISDPIVAAEVGRHVGSMIRGAQSTTATPVEATATN